MYILSKPAKNSNPPPEFSVDALPHPLPLPRGDGQKPPDKNQFVTLYPNIYAKHGQPCSLWELCTRLTFSPYLKQHTEQYQRILHRDGKKVAARYKMQYLPCYAPHGIFVDRCTIAAHSNLLCADWDGLIVAPPAIDEVEDLIRLLRDFKETVIAYRSASGTGVHALFRFGEFVVDADNHIDVYAVLLDCLERHELYFNRVDKSAGVINKVMTLAHNFLPVFNNPLEVLSDERQHS